MGDDNRFIRSVYRRCLISSMLAILGSVMGQIVSAIIIGRALGAEELSVIGITLPVYYVYATVGALLGVGGTTVCARLIGHNQYEDSRRAFTAAYLLMLGIAAALSAVMLVFSEQITGLLGVSPDMEIFTRVRDYMRILSIGGVFIMSIYPAFNLLRLDGRNTATAAVFFVMSGVNILLSYVLVLVMDSGVTGAAIATVCGAGASGVLGAGLLFTGSKNFRRSASEKEPVSDGEDAPKPMSFWRVSLDIIVSGSPSALENLCILTRTLIINWLLVAALHNMTALSAFKVTDSVNGFAQIFIAGAAGSLIPFIGVFSSERDTSSIRQLLKLGFKWSGIMVAGFTALCLIFTSQIAGLFGMGSGEALAAALPAIRIFALSLPLAAVNNILVCLYQASRVTAAANLLTLGRSLVWVVFAAVVLSSGMGVVGIWHSFWLAEAAAFICAVLLSIRYRRKNKHRKGLFLLNTEAEAKGTYKSFSVANSHESITDSAAGISEFCEANDLSPKQTMAISLAIEEMLVMISEHCFERNSGDTMNVRVLIYEDMVVLRIRSVGRAFNPIEYHGKNSDELDSLGIGMILKLAETVDYRNTFGVNNITIII